ncbi:hypothetical protein [Stakelama flava]|nr:hypothetical protein [Stakelama flava]
MLPRDRARWALALLIALIVATLTALAVPDPAGPADAMPPPAAQTDLYLYGAIVDGVRAGGDYYSIAANALRAGDFPLRPFFTFRLPTLAMVQSHLPPGVVLGMLWALGLAVALVWYIRLKPAFARPLPRACAMVLLAGGIVACVQPGLVLFHEAWAAMLIALSLGLWRPGRWLEAAAIGLCAMLIRETAVLYVLVMLAFALRSGDRREAGGWGATLAVFAVVMTIHAIAVARVVGPLDPTSPGWAGLNGLGFFIRALSLSTALHALPLTLAAILAGLAIYGWAGWNSPHAMRLLAVLLAYALLVAVFARVDTFYWALMAAPLSLIGLAFAPDAIRDTVRGALDRRRVRVHRVTR